jgi:hypothetical protein
MSNGVDSWDRKLRSFPHSSFVAIGGLLIPTILASFSTTFELMGALCSGASELLLFLRMQVSENRAAKAQLL